MSNEHEDFEESEDSGMPTIDPIAKEASEESHDEALRRKLKGRFGFADDEMKTLFSDRKKLRDFWADALKMKQVEGIPREKGEKADPKDTYDLPPDQAREIEAKLKRRKASKKKRDAIDQKRGERMIKAMSGSSSDPVNSGEAKSNPGNLSELEEKSPAKEADTAKPAKSLDELLGEDWDL